MYPSRFVSVTAPNFCPGWASYGDIKTDLKQCQIMISFNAIVQNMKIASFLLALLVAFQSESNTIRAHDVDKSNSVATYCANGLDFVSINQFKDFIEEFKQKSEIELSHEKIDKHCIKHRQAILDMEEIVSIRNVCDAYKIDSMVDYHKKYLKTSKLSTQSKPMTRKFFTKYAIQVAYTCKRNLLRNLELAREELRDRSKVFEEARDRVYRDEPSIQSNIKLIEEQPDDPAATNVKPRDEAELTLSEYREALTKLRRPEDILTFERKDCKTSSHRKITIARDELQIFFKPALMCHQLNRYYAGSILSIAKLANIGYSAIDGDLDVQLIDNQTVRDWLIVVQVCDPMLYMSMSRIEDDKAIIDTCSEKVASIEPMVFEDDLMELEPCALNEMVPKSEATRDAAQKLMKSALKRMAKANMMRQLGVGMKKSTIFKKSLKILSSRGYSNNAKSPNQQSESFSQSFTGSLHVGHGVQNLLNPPMTDRESFENLMEVISEERRSEQEERAMKSNSDDEAMSAFDPVSSLIGAITVMAIMLGFEWLFFVIMTLAARICHNLYFNFNNMLTFPPKVLSWSDADFARFNDRLEKIDEDDLYEYDELNSDERQQRVLLAKVFGKPPPMLYRE